MAAPVGCRGGVVIVAVQHRRTHSAAPLIAVRTFSVFVGLRPFSAIRRCLRPLPIECRTKCRTPSVILSLRQLHDSSVARAPRYAD